MERLRLHLAWDIGPKSSRHGAIFDREKVRATYSRLLTGKSGASTLILACGSNEDVILKLVRYLLERGAESIVKGEDLTDKVETG